MLWHFAFQKRKGKLHSHAVLHNSRYDTAARKLEAQVVGQTRDHACCVET